MQLDLELEIQIHGKGQKKSKWFFQANVSSKKQINKFYFATMKPQVDLFSFVFWRKLKTQIWHFEINWPLSIFIISLSAVVINGRDLNPIWGSNFEIMISNIKTDDCRRYPKEPKYLVVQKSN